MTLGRLSLNGGDCNEDVFPTFSFKESREISVVKANCFVVAIA